MRIIALILISFSFLNASAQTAEIYFIKATTAVNNEKFEASLDYLNKAIELDSLNSLYIYARSTLISGRIVTNKQLIHFEEATFEKALSDINKAIELDAYNPRYYAFKADLYIQFGKYVEAEKTLEEAEEYIYSNLDRSVLSLTKAELRYATNEIDASFQILEDALKVDSTNLDILNEMALNFAYQKDTKAALEYFNKVFIIDSENTQATVNVAFCALLSGKYEAAINMIDGLVIKYPNYGYLYNNRGEAYYHLGNYKKAFEDINKALELAPGNSYAYKNRALVYLAIDKKTEACTDLQLAKSLNYAYSYNDLVLQLLFDHCLNTNQKVIKE